MDHASLVWNPVHFLCNLKRLCALCSGASSNAQSYSSVSSKYILPNFRSGMAARFQPDSEQPKSPRGSPIKRVPTKLAGHTWRAVSLTEEESTAELRDFVGSVVGANTTVDRQVCASQFCLLQHVGSAPI